MKFKNTLRDVNAEQQENQALASHHRAYINVLAAAVCLLIAVLVWVSIMNAQDTDYIPVYVENPQSNVSYEFSADDVQVQGKVSALKHLTEINVYVPEGLPSGTYRLTEADLNLPDGVHPVGDLKLTLTVENN